MTKWYYYKQPSYTSRKQRKDYSLAIIILLWVLVVGLSVYVLVFW